LLKKRACDQKKTATKKNFLVKGSTIVYGVRTVGRFKKGPWDEEGKWNPFDPNKRSRRSEDVKKSPFSQRGEGCKKGEGVSFQGSRKIDLSRFC